MPLTFIDIERQKSWRISILFIFLLVMYFFVSMALFQVYFIFSALFSGSGFTWLGNNPLYLFIVMAFSLLMALIHFWFSAFGAVRSVMANLGASYPDTEDGIHKRLMDIMEEIHIVTGNKGQIKCMVIPSLSMNAIAVADLRGEAVIAITEGLLSRLTRSQLEAVMAHETYHILSGDCLETTVAASLFGMYASALEKVEYSDEGGYGGFLPGFLLFWVLLKLSSLLSMFISREREYRADAASLRMTRNPLAMAEALYLLSKNWTGVGLISSGLEMLCIVNPKATELDESEGWWADLMSTHPPIRKRIEILLKMARVSISEFEAKADLKTETLNISDTPEAFYYALDNRHQWQGPYSFAELASLSWLSPRTWVSTESAKTIERASENRLINKIFTNRISQSGREISAFTCPSCKQPLFEVTYEKTKVNQCNFCGGILVENDKIPRIIARREKRCTDRVKSLAKAVVRDNQMAIAIRKLKGAEISSRPVIFCSKCKNPMFRTFYSLAYLIEIDKCNVCGVTWFDMDELEMLQCIIENKITPKIELQID
jgi:heat shock protein HtpX